VYPLAIAHDAIDPGQVTETVIQIMIDSGILKLGDRLILTRGDLIGERGAGSNTMKIVDIPPAA
jgi:pyruvate kinase